MRNVIGSFLAIILIVAAFLAAGLVGEMRDPSQRDSEFGAIWCEHDGESIRVRKEDDETYKIYYCIDNQDGAVEEFIFCGDYAPDDVEAGVKRLAQSHWG